MVVCERADEVAEHVTKNKEVEIIAWNLPLKDGEAIKVAQSLKKNTALVKLVLYACEIGEKGGIELADALDVNTTLKEFDYVGNDIGGHANRKIKEVWTRTRLQWQGAIQVAGGRHVGDLQFAKKVGVRKGSLKDKGISQFTWAISELQTKKVKGLPALNSKSSPVKNLKNH